MKKEVIKAKNTVTILKREKKNLPNHLEKKIEKKIEKNKK